MSSTELLVSPPGPDVDPVEFMDLPYQLQTGPAFQAIQGLKNDALRRFHSFNGPKEKELYLKQRWREAGAFDALAEHDATRALQRIEEELVSATSSVCIPHYYPLDGHTQELIQYNWLADQAFRRGIGVIASLYAGKTIQLPDAYPGMSPDAYHDSRIQISAAALGRITIVNEFRRYGAPRENDDLYHYDVTSVGTPVGSSYSFSRQLS